MLGVSKPLVHQWIEDELLPATFLGPGRRMIRIQRVDLELFVQTQFDTQESSDPQFYQEEKE